MHEIFEALGSFVGLIWLIAWIIGVVLAKGIVSTIFSVLFPPYAWYLVVEWLLIMYNLI